MPDLFDQNIHSEVLKYCSSPVALSLGGGAWCKIQGTSLEAHIPSIPFITTPGNIPKNGLWKRVSPNVKTIALKNTATKIYQVTYPAVE